MNFFSKNRVSVASGGQANERSSIEPELLLSTLRSKGATGARTSLKKSICVLSVPPKADFQGTIFKLRKIIKIKFRRCLFMFSIKR